VLKRTALSLLIVSACTRASAPEPEPAPAPVAPGAVAKDVVADAKAKLVAKHGAASTERIGKGVDQAAALWRADDGDFVAFCLAQFVADPKERDALFGRMEATFEQIHGHFIELGRTVRWATEVESGPILPVDELLAGYDASAHLVDDLFKTKVGFAVLLNFPVTTLAERVRDAAKYDRRTWAELRLTHTFESRIPGDLAAAVSAAEVAGDQYIAGYYL